MKSYLAAVLLAYLLPSPSVLRRTALALQDGAAPVRVTGTLVVSSAAVPGLTAVPAVLTWRAPGNCRIQSLPNAPEPISWSVEKDVVTAPPTLVPALQAVCSMLGIGSSSIAETRASLDRRLAAWGINTQSFGLSRVKSGIVYEFGDANSPQFGVFKDNFLPARLMLPRGGQPSPQPGPQPSGQPEHVGGTLEVLLGNYANLAPGATVPRNIEVLAAGESLLSFTVISVERAAASATQAR